jgi:hypothetical protein
MPENTQKSGDFGGKMGDFDAKMGDFGEKMGDSGAKISEIGGKAAKSADFPGKFGASLEWTEKKCAKCAIVFFRNHKCHNNQ